MSSNDRGDDPRIIPSPPSREEPSTRNTIGGPNNGSGGDVARDNVVSIDATATTPMRPSRRAKPLSNEPSTSRLDESPNGHQPVGTDSKATPPPPAAGAGALLPPASPVTSPIPNTLAQPPSSDTPTGSLLAVPMVRSASAPGALAPAPPPLAVPLPPSVFDVEPPPTGAISFEGLFDPDRDDAGVPIRQRAVQFTRTGRLSRPRLRRVTRVVRHVDPWSVFKVALCFSLVLYGVCLTAGVLLWNVAYTTGTIDNVQRFFESFGWDTFRFKGGELYHNAWIAGLFGSLGLTGLIVLSVTLFNLITDLVGGIRVTVLEEEVVERNPVVRGPLLRRRTRPVSMIVPDHGFSGEGSPDSPPHLG